MIITDLISKQKIDFQELCKAHSVKYLYAFGSSVTDSFNSNTSDIDLLVEIDDNDPLQRGEKLISLWDKFEIFFQRKVDLLTEASIRNSYLKQAIEKSKILIYDRKS